MDNLFANPPSAGEEVIQELLQSGAVRIERIVSNGQPSPEGYWYDQDRDEWAMLAQGSATLEFENGERKEMGAGDYLLIPAHRKHRVLEVSNEAVWLAIHL
jgi:cupin 2 domain-containing protein